MTNEPFKAQVLDFNGAYWNRQKAYVNQLKQTQGDEAAKDYVEKMVVKRHFTYPVRMIPQILS